MKRFISTLALCISLLVLLSTFLYNGVGAAREDPLVTLLNYPAPPPPNPVLAGIARSRDPKFFDKSNPPKDGAPIGELLEYWTSIGSNTGELTYTPKPSDRTAERLFGAIEKDPKLLSQLLNVLPDGNRATDLVKGLYDRGQMSRDERFTVKHWLKYHTPIFSSDLAKEAALAGDTTDYVSNETELLALTSVDFDKARPIIDQIKADGTQKVSRVLAKWALYRHAIETDSVGDVETYRDELKAIVEDKKATPGMRDLAFDALSREKEWGGRDDWYYGLMADETLGELRVNGQVYTGLTTLIMYSPDEKYVDKMIELTRSSNPVVRSAAVKNLVVKLGTNNPEIVKALIPWLEDPKWANDTTDARGLLVRQLADLQIPESVPGLIKVLDEKQIGPRYGANAANTAANTMRPAGPISYDTNPAVANAMNAAANAANMAANAAAYAAGITSNRPVGNYYSGYGANAEFYPNRSFAVTALAKQKDTRAVPALRRILPEGENWEHGNVVRALLACGGFSVAEQLDALDLAAKGVRDEMDATDFNFNFNAVNKPGGEPVGYIARYTNEAVNYQKHPPTTAEIRTMLGQQLLQSSEITDELARAVVDRIDALDKRDPRTAAAYRRMILKWQNTAINLLLLRDLKRGTADADTLIKLLGQRKTLREQQSSDIFDIRTGKPVAIGIAACLLEDSPDYSTILENGDIEAKTALLACARLIRASLPIPKVSLNLKSPNALLQTAAERYLESEDSPEARTIVLSRHPNEAKILGAKTAFFVDGVSNDGPSDHLYEVFQSLGDDSLYNGWYGSGNDPEIAEAEKHLQDEVKKDNSLVGLYAYEGNYVRIYKDRVMFSWDEDESRYRERPMTKYEFDEIKSYLTTNRADELPPFNVCGGDYCTAKELVMLSRAGGRRVYMNGGLDTLGGEGGEFFAGLEKYFDDLKQTPATLHYALSREIPGLEIVLASDDLHAETVWKDGTDLRVVASADAVRKKVKAEIDQIDEDTEDAPYEETEAKKAAIREKRQYEGFAWYRITSTGTAEAGVAQPPNVEFIPMRDGQAVQASDEQWKARFGDTEIRASEDGLFRLTRGRLTKIRTGNYANVVVTSNGRWALATKTDDRMGPRIVRLDLVTNKEYHVDLEGYGDPYPSAYIPSINKILIVRQAEYDETESADEEDDVTPNDTDPETMILVDPATGATQPVNGEFRPLDQQTFRPLQKATKPNEFWTAMPDAEKGDTQVGIYDAKLLKFTQVLRIPKIKFNSMNMWVDEPGGRVYFVYRGHLLALPMKPVK